MLIALLIVMMQHAYITKNFNMPELPEVETVRLSLIERIIGQTVHQIEIHYPKIIKNVNQTSFKSHLINQTFRDILRLGKYLIFVLDDVYLISHLRMEGRYILQTKLDLTPHDHIIFKLNNLYMSYRDTRKFGTMHVYRKDEPIYTLEPLKKLGYEPFDKRLTYEYLKSKIHYRKRTIKSILLDQSIICGLGNIYVDEVLFAARIHPSRQACSLRDDEIVNIINQSKTVLQKALSLGGTTIRTFAIDGDVHGRFQNELCVHLQTKCRICSNPIDKIVVGGRGTYVCQNCQRE